MRHEIQKELRFSLRSGKLLILAAGFAFFSMMTPIMMKLVLPNVMKSQMPGLTEDVMAQLFRISQVGCIQSYMGDVLEIGTILIAFTLCGLVAQEIRDNTLVLPLCGGKRLSHIVSAKMLVFGAALVLISTLALSLNYLYSGVMFSFEIGYLPILLGGLMQGLFLVFMLANLLFWGSLIQKPVAAGLVTLGIVYALSTVGGLFKIGTYLPTGLMEAAQTLSATPSADVLKTVLLTAALIIALTAGALLKLRNMEWNRR